MSPATARAQLDAIVSMNIDDGASFISPHFEKMDDSVRLVGLGALQGRLKEPTALNNAIAAYLIKKKGFNKILLNLSNWELRPFNSYMFSDKEFVVSEFDSLFNKSFKETSYNTKEFKKFFMWIKNYNLSNKANRVLLMGGGFLEGRSKFLEMNDYFINTYVRPFSKLAADSLAKNWEAAKAKPTKEFDFIVLTQMFNWKDAVDKGKVQLPDILKYYLEFDFGERSALYEYTSSNSDSGVNTAELYYSGKFRFRIVDALMKDKNSKSIVHTSNMEVANSQVFLRYDTKEVELPFNGMEYKKHYKNSYLNGVTTFADSAVLWGAGENSEKKVVIYGDQKTKMLLHQKPVYSSPLDNSVLINITIPVFNKTVSRQYQLLLKRKEAEVPFDMVFIFNKITCDELIN